MFARDFCIGPPGSPRNRSETGSLRVPTASYCRSIFRRATLWRRRYSGPSVSRTMRNPLFCSSSSTLSRLISRMMLRCSPNIPSSGLMVLPENKTLVRSRRPATRCFFREIHRRWRRRRQTHHLFLFGGVIFLDVVQLERLYLFLPSLRLVLSGNIFRVAE